MEIELTDENFEEEVIERSEEIPVLVDFWASWCGPCRMLTPTLERISKDYKGKFLLGKMSVEENQITPSKYSIMSIPTVKLFKDGKIAAEFIGAIPEHSVKDFLDKNL